MTDQERTARLEGILEAWNRVLDRHEEEMRELRRQGEALNADNVWRQAGERQEAADATVMSS